MDKNEIMQRIKKVAQEHLGVILCKEELLKESGLDSLSLVILVLHIEKEFNISFIEDDLDPITLRTLDGLVELVEKYI